MKADQFPKDEKYERGMSIENAFMDDTALQLGVFDQRCFYEAFDEFDNQSIKNSLKSENLIVRIFAILDRRVGKRRLKQCRRMLTMRPLLLRSFMPSEQKQKD